MARVTAVPSDPASPDPGYEQARDELVDVVRRLEAGGTTLEESLALWERGEQLAAICQRWLDGARARLAAASTSADGEAANQGDEEPAEPADPTAPTAQS